MTDAEKIYRKNVLMEKRQNPLTLARGVLNDILTYQFGGGRRRLGKKKMQAQGITKLVVPQRPGRDVINRALRSLMRFKPEERDHAQADACLVEEISRFQPLTSYEPQAVAA